MLPKMKQGTPSIPACLAEFGFSLHLRDVVVAAKAIAHAIGIESVLGCRPDEHLAIAEIGALGKVELHEPLLHVRTIADLSGP